MLKALISSKSSKYFVEMMDSLTDEHSTKHIEYRCAIILEHKANKITSAHWPNASRHHYKRSGHCSTACWVWIHRHRHNDAWTNTTAHKSDQTNHNHVKIVNEIHQNATNHWNSQPGTWNRQQQIKMKFIHLVTFDIRSNRSKSLQTMVLGAIFFK